MGCLVALGSCGGGKPDGLQELRDGLELVYNHERVAEVEFTTPEGFFVMVGDYISSGIPEYVNAGFRFDDESRKSTGLRLRAPVTGGAGVTEIKYSLRVNFNYYSGPRFHGIDRIHFANNKNDPSLMREILFSRAARAMGVPASRTSYAWVKADGNPLGLYTMVEIVDERFVRALYGNENGADDGNLYKCEPIGGTDNGCSLSWAGDRKSDYLKTCLEKDGCGLQLKSNEDDPLLNNYADLIDFLDFLNNSSESEFAAGIEEVFDVDGFLRYLAVAVALGDHTGYLGNIDNFYLYHRPDTGRFVFIPWDHNKSMGLTTCALAAHRTGAAPETPECTDANRPLVDRILAVGAFRATYLGYMQEVVDTVLAPAAMQAWIDELEALIEDRIPLDPNSQYTLAQHQTAISGAQSFTNNLNLMEFVEERHEYLSFVLEGK
jgi:spore coat protein CotH